MKNSFLLRIFKKIKATKKSICKVICPQKPMREVVLIFPYDTHTKKLLIIEEFIHHYDRSFWKFCSGGIDKKGVDIITHAREELLEELSMESSELYHFHSSEKYFGARGIHSFIAPDPTVVLDAPENPDADIITNTKWISYAELLEMIDSRELLWNEGALVAINVMRKYGNVEGENEK